MKRDWKNGDEVEVEFDSRVFIVRDPSDQKRFAVRRGPFVYASDKRFDKAFGKPLTPELDGKYIKNAVPVKIDGADAALKIKSSDGTEHTLVDYPSAGTTWSAESPFTVWF